MRKRTDDRGGGVQLRLLAGRSQGRDWVLDERTRKIGRRGVAQAREVLRRSRRPEPARKAS